MASAEPKQSPKTTPQWATGAPIAARQRKGEIDPFTRTKIVELKKTAGWSYSAIHKRFPSIPLSTIKSTVTRADSRVNNISKARSGRPPKLDDADRAKLLEAIEKNPEISTQALLELVNHKCGKVTIRRLRANKGQNKQ
ncbi:Transposable element tc3 transposase [Penicillium chermesinum]|uniref:Transposable element tc3 transposase n=1 Tax=Penicillium chermesinum TaxID=63820 RepID=A0A9W9N9T5_9EURO|nr:Transposable element tc3 transposase [Penicillium chermesinum]KAJ5215034.1 Transposable element tc3 transposase [Penicillium chermesinum]KAJ6141468.1 Transposable element tc3 transposase [Penicillium chermesinum]